MPYKSQIRESDIKQLLEKVEGNNYGKYIKQVKIENARAFTNQTIKFDFPVTALIGPNGGGKTTILGATACAYKAIKPRLYFAKSGIYDDSMRDWSFEYKAIDKALNPNEMLTRKASFKGSKWRRNNLLKRNTIVFGVSRTVPANERSELRKCARKDYHVEERNIEEIEGEAGKQVTIILGKDVTAFKNMRVDSTGKVTLLTGKTSEGVQYSEFHFGAGESSIIRMVRDIESAEENSLILIEEIENGLHPIATIRMVEYLIDAALRKRIQAVFTTHSNDALLPLPSEAIWSATNGKAIQGKLDINSLRTISSDIDAELIIYVEDSFAKIWVEGMLRNIEGIASDCVDVYAMFGDGSAVKMNEAHNSDPGSDIKSICIIDGNSSQQSDNENVFSLPGEIPESYVYIRVIEKLDDCLGRLTNALHYPYERQEMVKEKVLEVYRRNRDPHVIFAELGKELRLLPEQTVKEAFISTWSQEYVDEINIIFTDIMIKIPRENR